MLELRRKTHNRCREVSPNAPTSKKTTPVPPASFRQENIQKRPFNREIRNTFHIPNPFPIPEYSPRGVPALTPTPDRNIVNSFSSRFPLPFFEKSHKSTRNASRVFGALPQAMIAGSRIYSPQCTPQVPSPPTIPTAISIVVLRYADSTIGDLQLFLHHLWTCAFRRIAHDLGLVNWGLASTGVCGAVGRLTAALDEDMSLQCILAREALFAMATREWLDG